jgi:UDP-N-acetyl-2-amino-2-deoxyglucuronate dehydrogenase
VSGPLRLALVGCGAISRWHRRAISEVDEVEIAACVDVDGERARETAGACGAAAHETFSAALSVGGLDAALVMVPHHLHETVAMEVLGAGLHLLLEKPMAPTLDACGRILAAAADAPGVFMVGENAQYWPEVRIVREAIASGAIGDVVTAAVHLFLPPLPDYYGGESPWRFDAAQAGGGLSIDTGSHYIRPLRMWLGEIAEVVAAMERPHAAMEGESLARALFRFESGIVASFNLLLTEGAIAPQDMFRITGTRGELTVGLDVKQYDREHRGGRVLQPEVPQGYLRSYAGQLRDFARAALEGRPLEAGPEASLGELRTALAMERSAKSGRWEAVGA